MIVVEDVIQGTPEWLQLHTGIPTASRFEKLVTPKRHEVSKSMGPFAVELATERLLGYPMTFAGNNTDWMERGSDLEAEAVRWYEFDQDVQVRRVGFVFTDDRRAGCSPDALVGEDGGLEIKCPSAHVHVGHLLGRTDPASATQVQGCLLVTGRAWWDVLSYCPGLPAVLIRTQRDEKLIGALAQAIDELSLTVEQTLQRLQELKKTGRIEGFGDADTGSLLGQLEASLNV